MFAPFPIITVTHERRLTLDEMMSDAEKARVGERCEVCREPRTASDIHVFGGLACGPCQCGDKPVDRRPSLAAMTLVMLPLILS